MKRALLAAALFALAVAVRAQPAPQAPSSAATFAGKLAELLTDTLGERDAARAQLAALRGACDEATSKQPKQEPPAKP